MTLNFKALSLVTIAFLGLGLLSGCNTVDKGASPSAGTPDNQTKTAQAHGSAVASGTNSAKAKKTSATSSIPDGYALFKAESSKLSFAAPKTWKATTDAENGKFDVEVTPGYNPNNPITVTVSKNSLPQSSVLPSKEDAVALSFDGNGNAESYNEINTKLGKAIRISSNFPKDGKIAQVESIVIPNGVDGNYVAVVVRTSSPKVTKEYMDVIQDTLQKTK